MMLRGAALLVRGRIPTTAGRLARVFGPRAAHGTAAAAAAAAGAGAAALTLFSSNPPAQAEAALQPCPSLLVGVWVQDMAACESMGPFLGGIGVPWFVWPIVDTLHTALHITSPTTGALQITDQTLFGTNTTSVSLDGSEVEKKTRGGRKSFMLSGHVPSDQPECAVITCRLFQRGEGWATKMERQVAEDGRLVERNVLVRPGEDDVVVTRYFRRDASRSDEQASGGGDNGGAAVGKGVEDAWVGALAGPGKKEVAAVGAKGLVATVAGGVVEVAEITAQRRELIGSATVLCVGSVYGCVKLCSGSK